jgi:proline dehydrogenase
MGIVDRAIANSVPVIPRPIVKKISSRYIAGDTLDEAVKTVRGLNRGAASRPSTFSGEHREQGRRRGQAKGLQEGRRHPGRARPRGGISIKLTGLGLTLNEELCRANLEEIVEYAGAGPLRAGGHGGLAYTEATLRSSRTRHRRYGNTGAVLQAYMRRSIEDVQTRIEAGSPCGCARVSTTSPEGWLTRLHTVRQNYILLLDELLRGGVYVGIATHDEFSDLARAASDPPARDPKDRYEFQMLLGVDEELRSILVGAGHKLRVYVPFGEDWYEYSTRRLKENPKIAGYVAKDVIGSITGAIKR